MITHVMIIVNIFIRDDKKLAESVCIAWHQVRWKGTMG